MWSQLLRYALNQSKAVYHCSQRGLIASMCSSGSGLPTWCNAMFRTCTSSHVAKEQLGCGWYDQLPVCGATQPCCVLCCRCRLGLPHSQPVLGPGSSRCDGGGSGRHVHHAQQQLAHSWSVPPSCPSSHLLLLLLLLLIMQGQFGVPAQAKAVLHVQFAGFVSEFNKSRHSSPPPPLAPPPPSYAPPPPPRGLCLCTTPPLALHFLSTVVCWAASPNAEVQCSCRSKGCLWFDMT